MTFSGLPDSFLLILSSYLQAPPLGCLSNTSTWYYYVFHIPIWQLKPVPFGSDPQAYLGTTASSRRNAANTWSHGWNLPRVLPKPYFPASALLRTTDLLEAHEIATFAATSSRVSRIVQPTITQDKWFTVPMCACSNCRPPWATNARLYQTIRRPEGSLCHSNERRVLDYSPGTDTDSESTFPIGTVEEAVAFPDPTRPWNQMVSHREENDWDLLAAVWSHLSCRPPGTASRHTNQMIIATAEFLGPEEITRLESRSNTERNINDLPWWPTNLRKEWRRLNIVVTTAPTTPRNSPRPNVSP
jgi:hypothetical protein